MATEGTAILRTPFKAHSRPPSEIVASLSQFTCLCDVQSQLFSKESVNNEQAHDRSHEFQYREKRLHPGSMRIHPKKDRAHNNPYQQRTSLAARVEECLA